MGTKASPYDEWKELYNQTPQRVDLSGFSIFASGKKLVSLVGSIDPKSFYLIERGSDDVISDLKANLTSKWSKTLSNKGEILELKDETGKVVDSVNCQSKWCAGSVINYKSMERGLSDLLWQTASLVSDYKDRKGNSITGSPMGGFSEVRGNEEVATDEEKNLDVDFNIEKDGDLVKLKVQVGGRDEKRVYRMRVVGDLLFWSDVKGKWVHYTQSWNNFPKLGNGLVTMKPRSGEETVKVQVRDSLTLSVYESQEKSLDSKYRENIETTGLVPQIAQDTSKTFESQTGESGEQFKEVGFYEAEKSSNSINHQPKSGKKDASPLHNVSIEVLLYIGLALIFLVLFLIKGLRMLKSSSDLKKET